MNKKKTAILIVSLIVIVIAALLASYFCFWKNPSQKTETTKQVSKTEEVPKEILPDYDHIFSVYAKYMKENGHYFSRGMMLCDLNDDKIPELFSIAYDESGDVVYFHGIKGNKVVAPRENSPKTYVDIYNLVRPTTFFEDPGHFIGIYKDRKSGQKVIINSIAAYSEADRLDIISFDGKKPVFKDEGVKAAVEETWPVLERRDLVMANYELCQDKLFTKFLIRGEFSEASGNSPITALKELMDEFRKSGTAEEAGSLENEEFYCYIKNIDMANKEITLIPAAKISYEEYAKAMNNSGFHTLNGETMVIQENEAMVSEQGVSTLYAEPGIEYQFSPPAPGGVPSVISGYIGMPPVKAKISNNLKVRYGVLGEYDENGEPTGYESLGRETELTINDYVSKYATYTMGSYFKAYVKGGKLVILDVFYKQ